MNLIDKILRLLDDEQKRANKKELDEIKASIEQLEEQQESFRNTVRRVREIAGNAISEDDEKLSADPVAEHQRACDQYIYRDRLLIQEFYFSIAAVGLAGNAIRLMPMSYVSVMIAGLTAVLLFALWKHADHIRQDRILMWKRINDLETELGMQVLSRIYKEGYDEDSAEKKRTSATPLMVKTIGFLSLASAIVAVVIFCQINEYAGMILDYVNAEIVGRPDEIQVLPEIPM